MRLGRVCGPGASNRRERARGRTASHGASGAGREPRQLPAVILFTAGNFSIAATHSVRLDNRRLRLCLLVSDPPTTSLCICEVGVSTWTTRVCIFSHF